MKVIVIIQRCNEHTNLQTCSPAQPSNKPRHRPLNREAHIRFRGHVCGQKSGARGRG